jgi:hypothetical protein
MVKTRNKALWEQMQMPVDFHDMKLSTDIIFLPQPHAVDFAKAQEIFGAISNVVGLRRFQHERDRAVMDSPLEDKEVTSLALMKDRISFSTAIVVGVSSIDADQFSQNLKFVAEECFNRMNIPFSVARAWDVELLLSVSKMGSREVSDARRFLVERAMHLEGEQIAPHFGRPAQMVGMRFLFPPTPQSPDNSFDVRIESFARDPGYFFISNNATFAAPLPRGNYEVLESELKRAEEFVKENVTKFLLQFGGE